MMRPEEIREMADIDIDQTLTQLADELFDIRMKSAYQDIENPMKIRRLKRDIAKLKTVKRERELAAAREAKEK
jgi:large subunit ribosomal protein L29